ncbi:hypothetical protein [Haliangium sp.]|uniref:hypothetical protein n=1 Tax=Haliangium sp. TaxID=2663208 RepID=UPI003D0DB529
MLFIIPWREHNETLNLLFMVGGTYLLWVSLVLVPVLGVVILRLTAPHRVSLALALCVMLFPAVVGAVGMMKMRARIDEIVDTMVEMTKEKREAVRAGQYWESSLPFAYGGGGTVLGVVLIAIGEVQRRRAGDQ